MSKRLNVALVNSRSNRCLRHQNIRHQATWDSGVKYKPQTQFTVENEQAALSYFKM